MHLHLASTLLHGYELLFHLLFQVINPIYNLGQIISHPIINFPDEFHIIVLSRHIFSSSFDPGVRHRSLLFDKQRFQHNRICFQSTNFPIIYFSRFRIFATHTTAFFSGIEQFYSYWEGQYNTTCIFPSICSCSRKLHVSLFEKSQYRTTLLVPSVLKNTNVYFSY